MPSKNAHASSGLLPFHLLVSLADVGNNKIFSVTTTKTSFSRAEAECGKVNANFARIETSAELSSALNAIETADKKWSYIWLALRKKTTFLTRSVQPCFSSYDNDVIKQKLKWVDGKGSHVDHLPWKYNFHSFGNMSLSSCSVNCMRVYASLTCLLYTSPSPRDLSTSRMPSSA